MSTSPAESSQTKICTTQLPCKVMFNLYVLGELERGVKLQQQKSKKTDFR